MRRPLALALTTALIAACGRAEHRGFTFRRDSKRTSPLVAPVTPDASPAPPAAATAPPPKGTIVFMRQDADARFQTWTACIDLTRARQLTSTPGTEAGWPVWSSDGRRIAFNANFDDADREDDREIWDIYTMAPDGSDVVRLTHSKGLDGDPGYSSDGTLIAFDSTVRGSEGIYVMTAFDGSGLRRVTGLPERVVTAFAPRFSPDGTEIVFTGEFDDHSGALFVVGVDGSGLRRITDDSVFPEKAAWSPDGAWIAFDASSGGFPFLSLWTVRPDGEDATHLMAGFSGEGGAQDGFSAPAWAPDGSMLLTVHGRHFADGSVATRLATVRPDGRELGYVTDGDHGAAFKPDWRAAAC